MMVGQRGNRAKLDDAGLNEGSVAIGNNRGVGMMRAPGNLVVETALGGHVVFL